MSVKYLKESFTNEFGQIIEVGAKIIAVKQSFNHTVSISKGIYLGLRRNEFGDVKNVAVKLKDVKTGYFLSDGTLAGDDVAEATYGDGIIEHQVTLPRMRIYPTI